MINIKRKEPLLTGELILPVLIVLVFMVIVELMGNRGLPPAEQHYTLPEESLRFQPLWSFNGYSGRLGMDGAVVIAIAGEDLFFLGRVERTERGWSLLKLDLSTGQVEMVIPVDQLAETIAAGDRYVYVGVSSYQKIDSDTLKDASSIVAYNIYTGDEVWSQPIRGARAISSVSTFGNTLNVFGVTSALSDRYEQLNPMTGQVLYSSEVDFPVLYSGDVWYTITPSTQISAINTNVGAVIWEREMRDLYFPPVLDRNVIVGRTGLALGRVYALDSNTGQLLWQSDEPVYSNVVASNGVAFYLTGAAQLKAVSVRTGQSLATLPFVSDSPQGMLGEQGNRSIYNVAVRGDVVLVYLGDSYQLFAFRYLPGR